MDPRIVIMVVAVTLIGSVTWLINNWLRMKHGYPTDEELALMAVQGNGDGRTRALVDSSTAVLASAYSSAQTAALQAPTVRALGMTAAVIQRQLALRANAAQGQADAHFAGGRFAAASRFIRLFVQSAALGLGALLAIAGEISAGAIVAGSILLGRALQPIDGLIAGWSTIGAARAALARLSTSL